MHGHMPRNRSCWEARCLVVTSSPRSRQAIVRGGWPRSERRTETKQFCPVPTKILRTPPAPLHRRSRGGLHCVLTQYQQGNAPLRIPVPDQISQAVPRSTISATTIHTAASTPSSPPTHPQHHYHARARAHTHLFSLKRNPPVRPRRLARRARRPGNSGVPNTHAGAARCDYPALPPVRPRGPLAFAEHAAGCVTARRRSGSAGGKGGGVGTGGGRGALRIGVEARAEQERCAGALALADEVGDPGLRSCARYVWVR